MAKAKSNVVEENGNQYTVITLSDGREIKIRHPKGKDLRFAMNGSGGNDADIVFKLSSTLTCLSLDELDELQAKDCSLIIKEVAAFLA